MKKHQARWLLAALSQAALASSVSYAQTSSVASLGDTVVTASRTPEDPTLLPIGVQVITGSEIKAAGMASAREAIRWLGGVVTRSDTATGREPVLDLRGFGETASSNTVILVDGVRQNEGDMNPTVLSWIPVDSIERIEIVRGSGAVLHGEGATAGVINIITSKGLAEPGGTASLAMGSNATRDARISLSTQAGNWRYQLNANTLDTDNHRQSFDRQEHNALARATWADSTTLLSAQLGGQSSKGHQPGGLTPADFITRPASANNLSDTTRSDIQNLLLSGEMSAGQWRLAGDINHRRSELDAQVPSFFGYESNTKTSTLRSGVRAWRSFEYAGLGHRFLTGLDVESWRQDIVSNFGDANIQQESRALYVRQEVESKLQGIKAFAGLRRTVSTREAAGTLFGTGALNDGNTSWEWGLAKRLGALGEVFGKTGTSFRLPNAGEYTCSDPSFCQPTLLRPQTSRDVEVGYRQTQEKTRWSIRAYRHELVDEIGYLSKPPEQFSNRNFDPTRREGLEFDLNAKLASSVEGGLQYGLRRAVFRSGDYAGKDMPLVPRQSITARLNYRMSAMQQWLLTTQFVSSQRIGDDFSNTSSERVPGYALLNLRYSHKLEDWTFSAAINNLTDRAYFNYRTLVDASKASVYPEAGRTFLVSAERRF